MGLTWATEHAVAPEIQSKQSEVRQCERGKTLLTGAAISNTASSLDEWTRLMTLIDEVTRRMRKAEQEASVTSTKERFAAAGAATPCYVLGRNEDSSRLLSQLTSVLGVIDDFAETE
ncbi:MAG: hypothetical protein P8L39_03665, partial [Halioglobus sp.]|nr:hypothetical protein [Halioglobus sp.]